MDGADTWVVKTSQERSWSLQKYEYYDGCVELPSSTGQDTKETEGQQKLGKSQRKSRSEDYKLFEHVSVLNSQSVLRNDVTSYAPAR